jgi:cytoskeletal protein CcmA (bactofilin family)
VFAEEDLRVDAHVEGNIECKGKVVVGSGGVVTGYIRCKNAELMGLVSGDLFVDGRLTLKSSVRYSGDISVRALEIEPGAIFNGTCRMVIDGE